MRKLALLLTGPLVAAAAGCAPRPLPPPAPLPPPRVVVQLPETVWTAEEGVVLHSEGEAAVTLPRPFTRLDVLDGDEWRLQVRCATCDQPAGGWIDRGDAVAVPTSPDSAAEGTLAEFALAVRQAAAERRLEALRPVMVEDFAFALVGHQSLASALIAWELEAYRSLGEVPDLLDRGLAPIGPEFWVAPPEHAHEPGFRGLRLGFRRSPAGRWEWLFLVRSEG